MKQSRVRRRYLEGMRNSLATTSAECADLIHTLEQITGTKKPITTVKPDLKK